MKRYQVIGGQYESYWYGESDSLHGAKCIATKHEEYWDNWQGFHKPKIYLSENVIEIESKGRITTRDGVKIRIPVDRELYAHYYHNGGWLDNTL